MEGITRIARPSFILFLITTLVFFSLHKQVNKTHDTYPEIEPQDLASPSNTITTTPPPDLSKFGGPLEFADGYFAPLLDGFRSAAAARNSHTLPFTRRLGSPRVRKVVMTGGVNKEKWLGAWFTEHLKDINAGLCPLPCHVTQDISQVKSADAVLIHLNFAPNPKVIERMLGPRDPNQPWIMFEVEAPHKSRTQSPMRMKSFDSFFNRTMYYRRDSDIRLYHGFVLRRGGWDSKLLPASWLRTAQMFPDNNNNDRARKLAVAFISDCRDRSGRLRYVQAMQLHTQVDVYGRCGKLKCGHHMLTLDKYRVDTDHCLKMAGTSYLFYLSFESALCEDYVTEKLYNALFYPIVPVVFGAADYTKLLPPHSYINARDYQPRELAQKLEYLSQHPEEYQRYLEWRQYYQPSTVGGARILCDLCVRLHDPAFYQHKVIHDFQDWFITKANCNRSGTVRNVHAR